MRLFSALLNWYTKRGIIIADPNITAQYRINRRIFIDVDDPRYDLAKDTLTYITEQYGMAEFSDNGDNGAWAEYVEGCHIYRKKIAAYRKRQFRI
jgi:hypothetical protein